MAKKRPQAKLLKQQSGYVAGTWELELEIERSEFNDNMKIIQQQTILDYIRATHVGEKIKALERANTADMISISTTYRPKTIIVTAILMITDPQQLFALTLGELLI